jgi:aspartate/methionine/tyrosine aminotransferase
MRSFHAPYMEWSKTRPEARFDLATSNILPCSIDDLPGAREAIALHGGNENGYPPLLEAIAARYGVTPAQVTTAQGASGANFLVFTALVDPGDEVLVERPAYDPLLAAPLLLGARIARFDREVTARYAVDPDAIRRAMTPRTRLIVLTSPHNPTGVKVERSALIEIGRIAESNGAHVLVDEVYLDAADASGAAALQSGATATAATLGDAFVATSSLTKSYGLSGLRCGWILSSADVAARITRARDLVDSTGSIVAERLATLAFAHLDRLIERSTALLQTNGAITREFLRSRPELDWIEPGGGTVVFPRLTDVEDTSSFAARLLEEHDTAIVPGRFFQAPAHFRLGFGGATDTLRGGLAQIAAALAQPR